MLSFTFKRTYFILTVLLFFVEFLIGTYTHDAFVRPYVGDFFVVIFLYCLFRAFLDIGVKPVAITVLLISYLAEYLQYINILDVLGIRQSALANVLLGNWFEWSDILAYSLGIVATVIAEQMLAGKNTKAQLFI